MIRKIILMFVVCLVSYAHGQTTMPVADDANVQMYTAVGSVVNRYIRTDKTGPLQFLMFGQDPTPGAPVGQVRPQRRLLGPSIVCGSTFDSTCDVVASAVTISSSQINDATSTGRGLLTASSSAVALSTIGAASSSDLSGGLSGKANTAHTHVLVDITDTTATGRTLASASGAASARNTLGLGSASLANTPSSGNAAGADVVIATDTRLADARAPLAHTQAASTISDSTTAGRSILTAVDFAAQRSLMSVLSASESNAAFYPLVSNPSGFINLAAARSGISVTGNGSYNGSTGVITINSYTPPARVKTNLTKAIGVCFQISATRDAQVSYNVQITASAAVIGGAQGTLFLETFTDSACTTGTVEEMRSTSGNTNGLAISLGNVLTQTLNVNGWVFAGQYAKLRTNNDTGNPTYAARPGWEIQQ